MYLRPLLCGFLAALLATLPWFVFPVVKTAFFARAAAEIAGLFTGAPVIPHDTGWLLPFQGHTVWVTALCSGTTFFSMLATLLAARICLLGRSLPIAATMACLLALPAALFINGIRILLLVQAHAHLIPLLPERFSAAAHLGVGVLVFLPSLILINLCFEYHGSVRSLFPKAEPR